MWVCASEWSFLVLVRDDSCTSIFFFFRNRRYMTLYKWLYDEVIFLSSKKIKLSNDIFLNRSIVTGASVAYRLWVNYFLRQQKKSAMSSIKSSAFYILFNIYHFSRSLPRLLPITISLRSHLLAVDPREKLYVSRILLYVGLYYT